MEDLQHRIFSSLERGEVEDANNYMLYVCKMLTEDSTATTIDGYINLFFTQGVGVLVYLTKILKFENHPSFHKLKSIPQCFEVIFMLLNNFPKQMEDHYKYIMSLCSWKMLHPKWPSCNPKCAEIFHLLVSSNNIELKDTDLLHIYSKVKDWLNSSKSTVQLEIFIKTLACFSKKKCMKSKTTEIGTYLVKLLGEAPHRKTGMQNILRGGYIAIDEFMIYAEFQANHILLIYQYLKRDVIYPADIYKKQGTRACLQFITNHAHKFTLQMQCDIQFWSNHLKTWCNASSKDDSSAGFEALHAVFKSVCHAWGEAEEAASYFNVLLLESKHILENSKNDHETKLGICTLGYMAPAASKFMTCKDFLDLFIYLLQKIEYFLMMNDDSSSKYISGSSCDYVEGITPFFKALKSDIGQHINIFKRVSIIMIKMFPKINSHKHKMIISTLKTIFLSVLDLNYMTFQYFLEEIVKQGVLWTCSHKLAQEIEMCGLDETTYKHYLPLWKGLLLVAETDPKEEEFNIELYNQLMENLIYMSNKLNLNIIIKEADTQDSGDVLQSEKCNDFVIFANVTDFYCDLLDYSHENNFKRWIDTLSSHMIRKSMQLPLVSGFYKLLSTCMKRCGDINFFAVHRIEKKEHVKRAYENFKTFLEHVLKKITLYKNELQLACVLLVLHTPINIIRALNYEFSGIFTIAFKIGQHNFPLACIALNTLDRWYKELDMEVSFPLLKKIVPSLDAYLRNQFVIGDSYHVEGRKIKKYRQRKITVEAEPELITLQHKVLRFLATMPNDIIMELISTSGELKLNHGETNVLQIKLPFGERSLGLWMDPFLDRVLLLSIECTDRKIRITACELLHAIIAIFLGTSVVSTSDLEPILEKLLKALVQLSCDQDSTVVNLFNPLVLQLAHWFAHPKQIGSTHSHCFIKILMEGVTSPNDVAVRDQAGKVLREFVAWTRKQNTKTSLKKNLYNIQLIIDHLNQFCLHPDDAKRFGATVIFNNIYRELREEDVIIDRFWLEIMYAFVMNLSLVQFNDTNDDLLAQICLCLDRVTRCLIKKQALFETVISGDQRGTPPKFTGNTFSDAALFLLTHTWHINIHCRTKCIEIFKQLPTGIIVNVLKHFDLKYYMHDLQTTLYFKDLKTIEEVLRYYVSLTCFIDGHIFITQLRPSVDLAESVLWEILNKIIEEFKLKNLDYIQKMLKIQEGVLIRRIKDEFSYVKSKLIEKVFELFEVLLANDVSDFINGNSWSLLADYLFDYNSLGLSKLSKEKWEINVTKLLKMFLHATKFNNSSLDIFALICRCGISNQAERESFMSVETEVSLSQRQFLRGILVLKRTDTDDLIQLPSLVVASISTISSIFKLLGLDTADTSTVIPKLKDTQREYFTLKLELALNQVLNPTTFCKEFHDLLLCLCDDQLINVTEINGPVEKGYFLFLMFKQTIFKYTATEDRLFNLLHKMVTTLRPELSIRYFKDYLKYLHKHSVSDHSGIKEELIKSAEMFYQTIINSNNYMTSLELIHELKMVLGDISSEVIRMTVISCLHKKQPSDMQQMHHLAQLIRTLSMVSPRGLNEGIEVELTKMKKNNMKLFKLETKRVSTTLLIKTMVEATSYSHSLNFFIVGLDFYITIDNDFELDAVFCRDFMKQLPIDLQEDLISGIYYLDNNYTFHQKIVLTLCLCNLLAFSSYEAFEAFYIRHISQILEVFSLDSYENKTLSCIHLNRLFGNIKVENFEAHTCQITRAVCAKVNTGKELLEKVAKILLNVCKDSPSEVDPEVFRLYQCYAYNALTTLVCNALKGKADFYQRLFVRSQDGEDILWCKLVPLDKKFNFEMVVEDIPKKKKVLLDIRTEFSGDIKKEEYIESQNLFLSTLAEDITNYDFTNVSVRYKENLEVMNNQKSFLLEMDQEDINSHECMTQICGVLKHMHENDMLPAEAPPQWIYDLNSMLLKPTVPINIRQFLCKVFENCQIYLKQYAHIFITGVIRTIKDTCENLNSLAGDLIVMLLTTWKNETIVQTAEEVNNLIPFMISKIWHERSDVFKYNVNLFRTTIETYNTLNVSEGLIESLFVDDIKDMANLAPIHIINILLVNNISPFSKLIKQMASAMIKLLHSPHRSLYKATAETLGLSLKFLDDTNHPSLSQFIKRITSDVRGMLRKNELIFVDVFESIVKYYPLFGSTFLDKHFIRCYAEQTSSYQISYLKIILKCIAHICESGFINNINLSRLLKSPNLETQLIAFEIVLQAVDYLEISALDTIIELINNLPDRNPVCRSICTDIMIAVYRRFHYSEDDLQLALIKRVRRHLISGFVDVEPEIRNKISMFWTESDILPNNLETKMIYLLENMYDCNSEDIYLAFSNLLLLNGLVDNGDPIFKPLHKCEFRNYEVTAHWRAQNASMMPMFTQSVHSQQYLQATQSYNEFDETQMLATQRQSYMETASILGTKPISNLTKTSFKNPNDMELGHDYKIRKWRFFKNKADVSKMHAIREFNKGKEIDKMREDVRKKKEVQVKIYRSYRTGDFPDIEINISSIIDPLKELTKKDDQIAQILYKSLFDSIVDIAVDEEFMPKVNNAITNILATTTTYNPAMIGAFLHIALEYKNNMSFQPNLIKSVANNSGALSYGCLLLEEYLLKSCDFETSAKRGVGTETSDETMHWVKLAELYKTMEEWDVVHGIFRDKMTCSNDMVMAIHAESENYWSEAREFYLGLIKQDYDLNRKDFYYEAFFKCSEELSDWKDVDKRCEETMQGNSGSVFNDLWSTEWYKKTLLPYYIKAQVRIGDKQEFENKLKEIMKDGSKKEYIRNEFADELAYFYLDCMKIKSALNYSALHAKNFLHDWKFIKPLYTSLQNKMLLRVKNCVEIATLFQDYDTLNSANFNDVINGIINVWHKSNMNDSAASTPHLTTRNNVRESFIKILNLKLLTLNVGMSDENSEEIVNKLSAISFNSEVMLIQQALRQKNLPLARKYTGKNIKTFNANGHVNPISYLLFSQVALLKAKGTYGPAMYLESFKGYHKCVNNPNYQDDPAICIPALMHLNDLCQSIVEASEKENFDLESIQAYFTSYPISRFSDLLNYSFENMRDTLYRLDKTQKGKCLADAFLKLAKEYANRGMGYENKYIECSLKSIEYGSEEARLLFPNLLEVVGLLEVHRVQFIQQTSKIPIWMFIRWIPQLLAHVDTPKVSVIKDIVIKLGTEYPSSIIYAYKLSRDKYTFTNDETYEVTNKLDELLQNTLVDKMLKALSYVCVPVVAIRTALSKLKKACEDTEYVFRTVGEGIVANLFAEEMDTFSNSLSGSIHRSVIKNKPKLLSIINYSPFDKTAIIKKIDEFCENIIDADKESVDLGHYSPWLNYFHAPNYEQEIEVPGRYVGNFKPLPHYHPKISKFSSDVAVFKSLRKPIRITIFANDVKEYRFLVKYGEDLRLDQRVQQLFKLMNVILSSDIKCHERKLNVSTFEVIPLTGDLGFIQWVDETEILKNLITKSSGYKTITQKMKQAYEKYSTWIEKAGRGANTNSAIYAKALMKYNRDQTSANYNQIVNMLPWDALRKSFWNITPDPEMFFALRHTFVKSYAVMCICNWVLGIGDRHLQNILMSMASGHVVGIDFGHAFGSGTQQQTVPELVPFRLTPQIMNLMLPFKESGLLHQTMVHTLRVLRDNSEMLLSTMNIFILEPSLNWSENTDEGWNPRVILNLAKAKFTGRNPINIMIDEIKMRTKDTAEVNLAYVQCLKDLMDANGFEEDANVLSVNEQVKRLIAHATDANLLGRMWQGWESWI